MRNLKKVLSLALVLVMACGLFVTASASDYTDDANISYKTAVEVLSGVGILEGYADGSFLPKGNVNRGQAAKIIAYLLLGKESADALSTNVSPFSDVPAGHWAAGYIQYCVNQGIINGYGNNTFKPTNLVTTAQFAKMLLVALGYGANDEFIGNQWKTEVIKYASRADLFKDNYSANPDAYANREESALYAFNAMFAPKVVYSALLGDYMSTVLGSQGDSYGSFAEDYQIGYVEGTVEYDTNDSYYYVAEYANQPYESERVIGIDADPSDIGRYVTAWYQLDNNNNAISIANVSYEDTVIATKYDGNETGNGAQLTAWTTRGTPAYVAGLELTGADYYIDGKYSANIPAYNKGDKVELLDTNSNGRIDRVLVTTYSAASVAAAPVVIENAITGNTVSIAGVTALATATPVDKVVGYENLQAGDVIYYNYNTATETYYITKAVAVAGQKTAYVAATGAMTFGGATYTASGIVLDGAAAVADLGAIAFNSDATIYLDAGGYVLTSIAGNLVLNYAVLDDVAIGTTGSGLSGTSYLEARLAFTDGSTEIIRVSTITVGNTVYGAEAGNGITQLPGDVSALQGQWYNYVVGTNDTYALTQVASTPVSSEVTGNVASFATGLVANNNTVFLVKLPGQGTVYTVYTGYAALPSTGNGNSVNIKAVVPATGIATYVYFDASGIANYGSVTGNYAFISNPTATTYSAGTFTYNAYSAVVNGAAGSINAIGNAAAGTVGIYQVTYDANGYVSNLSLGTKANGIANYLNTAPSIASNGVVMIATGENSNDVYAYNAQTVAYIVNSFTGAVTTGTVENITLGAVKGTSIVFDTNTNTVKEIYVLY